MPGAHDVASACRHRGVSVFVSMLRRALGIVATTMKTSHGVESICESDSQKVGKSSPVRAMIAPKPNFPENIFVAKNRDSESAERTFFQSQSYPRF